MTEQDVEKFVDEAIAFYGGAPQMAKTVEELVELRQAIEDFGRGEFEDDRLAVVDEIADVMIMVRQMRSLFGRAAVDARVEFKIRRQRARMSKLI